MSRYESYKVVVLSDGTDPKIGGRSTLDIIVYTPLVGTLTVTGLRDENGEAATLVLPIAFSGRVLCGKVGPLTLQKSSASDDGKILLAVAP